MLCLLRVSIKLIRPGFLRVYLKLKTDNTFAQTRSASCKQAVKYIYALLYVGNTVHAAYEGIKILGWENCKHLHVHFAFRNFYCSDA